MTDQPSSPHAFVLPRTGRQVALGRPRPSVWDDPRAHNVFRLARYIDRRKLGPPPDRVVHSDLFTPRMFANDQVGDCTIAGQANFALLAAAMVGRSDVSFTDQDVLGRYARLTGYDPQTGANDNGAVELDVLTDWRHDAFNGVELCAFASIDVHDLDLLRHAIALFGAVYVGLNLPSTAQDELDRRQPWDVVAGTIPGSWGGHCTIVTDCDWTATVHLFNNATWASFQPMTEAFWRLCGDECYAPLTSAWRQQCPQGMNWDLLDHDLAMLGQVH